MHSASFEDDYLWWTKEYCNLTIESKHPWDFKDPCRPDESVGMLPGYFEAKFQHEKFLKIAHEWGKRNEWNRTTPLDVGDFGSGSLLQAYRMSLYELHNRVVQVWSFDRLNVRAGNETNEVLPPEEPMNALQKRLHRYDSEAYKKKNKKRLSDSKPQNNINKKPLAIKFRGDALKNNNKTHWLDLAVWSFSVPGNESTVSQLMSHLRPGGRGLVFVDYGCNCTTLEHRDHEGNIIEVLVAGGIWIHPPPMLLLGAADGETDLCDTLGLATFPEVEKMVKNIEPPGPSPDEHKEYYIIYVLRTCIIVIAIILSIASTIILVSRFFCCCCPGRQSYDLTETDEIQRKIKQEFYLDDEDCNFLYDASEESPRGCMPCCDTEHASSIEDKRNMLRAALLHDREDKRVGSVHLDHFENCKYSARRIPRADV